jgi:Bacterial Ig-like domain (group 3)/Matrixin
VPWGGELNFQGGLLTGSGTVSGDVYNTAGQVNPGGTGAPGMLTINGSYSQASNGVLNIEIAGPTAESQYDQLNVNGPASLGGTLNVSLLSELGEICDGAFVVLNGSPVSGTFSTINGLSQAGGQTFTPTYSSTHLTLTASKFAATTVVTASANPSLLNQPVTFTATISPPAGTTDAPTGTVQFQVDGNNVGTPVSLNNGQASFNISSLTVGPHTITALYSGDQCFYAGSGSLTQQVHYQFGGFLAPLNQNMPFALNRNIPIKFQLSDFNNAQITSLSAVTALQIAPVNANNTLGTPFNPASTGNAGLHLEGNTYSLNWQTKGLAAGTYEILLTLADGTVKTKVLTLSANGSNANAQAADGSDVTLGGGAGQLMGGDLQVYVDNSNGDLTADELARIQDAVTAVDAISEPYGVTVEETTDPTQAEVTLSMDTTSPVGGYAGGILGCFDPNASQITLIAGWNWYAGSDPSQVGSGQYDFQTTVTHELGHALGLGESSDSTSAMYGTLAPGAAMRTLTTADLNLPADESGADAQRAAPLPVSQSGSSAFAGLTFGSAESLPDASSLGEHRTPTAITLAEPLNAGNGVSFIAFSSRQADETRWWPATTATLPDWGSDAFADASAEIQSGFPGTCRRESMALEVTSREHADTKSPGWAESRLSVAQSNAKRESLNGFQRTHFASAPGVTGADTNERATPRSANAVDCIFAALALGGMAALPVEMLVDGAQRDRRSLRLKRRSRHPSR